MHESGIRVVGLLNRPGGNITEARREDVINGEADCIESDEKGVWILL